MNTQEIEDFITTDSRMQSLVKNKANYFARDSKGRMDADDFCQELTLKAIIVAKKYNDQKKDIKSKQFFNYLHISLKREGIAMLKSLYINRKNFVSNDEAAEQKEAELSFNDWLEKERSTYNMPTDVPIPENVTKKRDISILLNIYDVALQNPDEAYIKTTGRLNSVYLSKKLNMSHTAIKRVLNLATN